MSPDAWLSVILAIIFLEFALEFVLDRLNAKSRRLPVPKKLSDIYTPEKYERMQTYHNELEKLGNLKGIFSFLLSISIIYFGVLGWLSDWTLTLSNNIWINALVFFGVVGFVTFLIGLPFSIYKTFVIEEKYGFNRTTKRT